jgi:hypothetical protein
MFMSDWSALMTPQKATMDSTSIFLWFVSYRYIAPQFQFTLSAATLEIYLYVLCIHLWVPDSAAELRVVNNNSTLLNCWAQIIFNAVQWQFLPENREGGGLILNMQLYPASFAGEGLRGRRNSRWGGGGGVEWVKGGGPEPPPPRNQGRKNKHDNV